MRSQLRWFAAGLAVVALVMPADAANKVPLTFAAEVLGGAARRMLAEGEPLGAGGGQPARDLEAALQAKRTKDYAALSVVASAEMAAFLSDPAERAKNLEMLRQMTPPRARVVGGLRQGERAQLYWVQIWPDALDSRCLEDLILQDGKWRSVSSACAAE